jgi:hypothetical protein
LVAQNVIDVSTRHEIQQREVNLEVEHSIPVRINLDRVSEGDLLISDMYLPGSAILQMVRSVGLEKQVSIYQSNGDKSTGDIWRRMQDCKPNLHLGDNTNSDYNQAKANGINAELYPGTHFNGYEQDLHDLGLRSIALLSREIRLATVTASNSVFTEIASSLNLPLLFVSIELLQRKHRDKQFIFLGRDGQLLHKIYNSYFGVAGYLPFSRKVAYDNPTTAYNYLKRHSTDNTVFVDISSTGGTWQNLSPVDITVLIYSDKAFYTPEKPVLPATFNYITTNSEIGQTDLLLEVFNCGDHGPLEQINELVPGMYTQTFGTPELSADIVEAVHAPAKYAHKLRSIYASAIRNDLLSLDEEQLKAFMHYCTANICARTELYQQLGSFVNNETQYLNQFTK